MTKKTIRAVWVFLLTWIGGSIVLDILFALLGLEGLNRYAGGISFLLGIWLAKKEYDKYAKLERANQQEKSEGD